MEPGESSPVPANTPHKRWGRAFVRNGALLMGSSLVQSLAGFASQLIMMRLLVPADFGGFALILASIGLVQVIFSPRLGTLAILARDDEYTEDFRYRLNSAMAIEAVLSLALILVWQAAIGISSFWVFPLALTLALGHWVNSVMCFYEREMSYRHIAAIETGSQVTGHAIAVALVLAGAGVASLYLREAVVVVFRLGLLLRIGAIPRWPLRWVTLADWRVILRGTRVPWLDGIVDGGFQRLTVLAVGSLCGVHDAGLFVQAQRLAMVPHQLLSPVVVRLAGNLFSRIEGHGALRTLERVALLLSLPLLAGAAGAWAFGDPVVPWLFGQGWQEAGPVLSAMAGVVIGFTLFELCRSYCLAQRRNTLLLAGRVAQYAVFAIGCVVVAGSASAASLGGIMSAVAVISAMTLMLGLAKSRGGR